MHPLAATPLLVATVAHAQQAGLWFTGLAPQTTQGSVSSLTQDGGIAAGLCFGSTPYIAPGFVWTRQGGRQDFAGPGMPPHTPVYDMSSDGGVIVGYTQDVAQPRIAYRRTGSGPFQSLGLLPNETRSQSIGVSGDGSIVVGTAEHDVPTPIPGVGGQAFRWTQGGGMQGLGYLRPGGYFSEALGISRDGSTIIGTSQSGGAFNPVEAFRWTHAGGMQNLPLIPGSTSASTYTKAVNADGSVIVGAGGTPSGRPHALRWTPAGAEDLGVLSDRWFSHAYAVSDDGLVVGGTSNGGGPPTLAFVWTPTLGMTDLSSFLLMHGIATPAEYRLEYVLAISGDGLTFAGQAVNLTTNLREGFVATIPSPSAAMVMLLAPLVAARRRPRG